MVWPNGSVGTLGPGTDLNAQKETAMNYLKPERVTLEQVSRQIGRVSLLHGAVWSCSNLRDRECGPLAPDSARFSLVPFTSAGVNGSPIFRTPSLASNQDGP
jgi:hypothetical protein